MVIQKLFGKKSIGLALGGGGARGLAHIPVLQVFEELGVRPAKISGTSMGGIVAAIYASGTSPTDLRELIEGMIIKEGEGLKEIFRKRGLLRWFDLFDPKFVRGGVFKGDKVAQFLQELIKVETFEELQIPVSMVATDFFTGDQVVFDKGPLMPAIRATMALPGIFTPVELDGRLLVDGGCVNLVPHDLLDKSLFRIAVDVKDLPQRKKTEKIGMTDTLIGAVEIMSHQIGEMRRELDPPDLYLHPDLGGFDMLEFFRAEQVFRRTEPVCKELREALANR